MIVSRNGKIHEGIDPWIFSGMTRVFSFCTDCHCGVTFSPDSRYWDFRDLPVRNCIKCGRVEYYGGKPTWRLTTLPIKVKIDFLPTENFNGRYGFFELIWGFFSGIFKWWNDP